MYVIVHTIAMNDWGAFGFRLWLRFLVVTLVGESKFSVALPFMEVMDEC